MVDPEERPSITLFGANSVSAQFKVCGDSSVSRPASGGLRIVGNVKLREMGTTFTFRRQKFELACTFGWGRAMGELGGKGPVACAL